MLSLFPIAYIDTDTFLRQYNSNGDDLKKLPFFDYVFGKNMDNVDKRVDIKLVSHFERIGKRLGEQDYIAKPSFKNA